MERLRYVDVFRGIAILVMVFFHIIDVLAPVSVYSDFPYYSQTFEVPIGVPPPFLFLFVAGMSSYLLVKKRREEGNERKNIAREVTVKYGKYVLISLPFTALVFGLPTYLAWEEALQGIGLTIVVLGIMYLYTEMDLLSGLAVMVASSALQANRALVLDFFLRNLPATNPLLGEVGAFFYNALLGGWFSLTNLLPFAIGGFLMIKLIYEDEDARRTLHLGILLTSIALFMTLVGYPLAFYERNLSLGLYGAGSSMLIYYLTYRLWEWRKEARFFTAMEEFGKVAFLVYIWHFILIIKGVELLGVAGRIGHLESYLVSLPITYATIAVSERYVKFRGSNGPLTFFLWNRLARS